MSTSTMEKVIIDDIVNKVNEDTKILETIIDDVVARYTKDLDTIMHGIKTDVLEDSNPSINVIEKYFLELSSCLYFMCEKVEKLGLLDSISKSNAQEVYNNKYLEYQHSDSNTKKPTVAELTALSESGSLYDRTVNDMYNKAYKIVKNKINSAETMVSTLSKILSHRIQESNLTQAQTSRQILNEGELF